MIADADDYLDALELRESVLAPGVVLSDDRDGGYLIPEVRECRAHRLGRYATAADAWRAIDALDDAAAGFAPERIATLHESR